ncbi:insulinase family protein [Permianibacter sp. IMCC34836]|uniref:M16 family metallopeptidase n=1 Tax=Permianibacter fluminis TaxID=2738515 RepID=UPI001551E0CC|nr:pitrilysin family protein [Permianibacter fluminis]NQD37609.1 insulinase family protein [Permianibacter fluminis]
MERHFKRRVLLAASLFGLMSSAQAVTTAKDVQTLTLANGMKFLVLEDHSIPNANFYVFWKVGSRNEHPGITGLSHFFEHMMFNGAKKYGPKQFDRVMEANGGANNAYTTNDVTVYTDWFPASALATIFDLEADRIADLNLDDAMVASERGVVASERTTGLENSPWRTLGEEVDGAAFRAHPYSWPVIGHESDIKNWKKSDLQSYFDTYYAPNNAVAVVVGDVEVAEVKKLAEQYFAPIPAAEPPRPIHTVEPEQKGEKRLFVQKDSVSTPHLLIGYKTPAASHPDYYALSLLTSILAEGNSSRLYQALVDSGLATMVGADYEEHFDPYLLGIYAIASGDTKAAQIESVLYAEIDKLIKNGVSKEELQKARSQKLMRFYKQLETINGKANTLGTYEVYFGSYDKMFNAPKAYEQVSAADIQRVARDYLSKSRRTVGILAAKED